MFSNVYIRTGWIMLYMPLLMVFYIKCTSVNAATVFQLGLQLHRTRPRHRFSVSSALNELMIYTCISLSLYIYIYTHTCVCIHIYVYIYIYTYIHIHIHTYNIGVLYIYIYIYYLRASSPALRRRRVFGAYAILT